MNFNLKPFYLGRISGIPIQAHYSWLPVFPIYAWVISQVLLPRNVPGRPIWEYWALGILTTVLLFASVLIHELAHSILARIENVGTGSITLYLFGGLASLGGAPDRARGLASLPPRVPGRTAAPAPPGSGEWPIA